MTTANGLGETFKLLHKDAGSPESSKRRTPEDLQRTNRRGILLLLSSAIFMVGAVVTRELMNSTDDAKMQTQAPIPLAKVGIGDGMTCEGAVVFSGGGGEQPLLLLDIKGFADGKEATECTVQVICAPRERRPDGLPRTRHIETRMFLGSFRGTGSFDIPVDNETLKMIQEKFDPENTDSDTHTVSLLQGNLTSTFVNLGNMSREELTELYNSVLERAIRDATVANQIKIYRKILIDEPAAPHVNSA